MTLSSARALVPLIPAIAANEQADHQALTALASWARQYGPLTCCYSEQAIVAEIWGSVRLFGGEQGMIRHVQRGTAKLGYFAHVAIAPTPRAAHVLAWSVKNRIEDAPVSCLSLTDTTLEGLYALGIKHIGDLLKLPRSSWSCRFGEELPRRIAELLGDVQEDLAPLESSSPLIESMDFDPPIEDGSSLAFVVKRLSDHMAERLKGTGIGAIMLVLLFRSESAEITSLEVRAAHPLADHKALLLLLNTKLERLTSLERIEYAQLEVKEHAPLTSNNHLLFEPRPHKTDEAFTALLDRLCARLGSENVIRAELVESHKPEKAWQAVPFLEGGAGEKTTFDAIRPTVLFDEPIALSVGFERGQPSRVGSQRVVAVDGPERIRSGWWNGAACRDYWRVTLDDGRCIWLYRDEASGRFFEHGVFA